MTKMSTGDVREYYRQITDVDIGLVARELLAERIVQEDDHLLQCDCPNHQSSSHRSLQVLLDKQGWYCFGCGVGGDVLQLVEFVQSGAVTSGQSGPMPETHQRARDFLAAKVELPPLARYGLSPERLRETEAARELDVRVQEALTALASFYHRRLKEAPEVLEWLTSRYGIAEETIDTLRIGYAANGPCQDEDKACTGVLSALTTGENTFIPRKLAATGAFRPTGQDGLLPFFEGRIVFPYWSHGRVVFLIGRKTPWTPDQDWEQGKYRKLPVHNAHSNRHIAPSINNGHLYNEDCLLTRPERVIITEGVTDCIALMERGFPAVSPVTVRIRASDWDRLLPKLRGIKTVYICQDNEISEAGLNGALKTASVLAKHEIQTRLVVLPLDDSRQEARAELKEQFDLDAAVGPRELAKLLAGRTPEELREAEHLLAASKIDVNDYFASGHTAQDFEALLAEAGTPLECVIDRLPTDVDEEERNRLLEPILREISALSPLEQSRHLKRIQERFGKSDLSLTTLREQVRAMEKERSSRARDESRRERIREKRRTGAQPGSCRARVEQVLIETEEDGGSPDYAQAAEAAYDWFTAHGAQFFFTRHGEPFMHFDNAIYWMDSADRGRKRQYSAMLYRHTSLVPTSPGGRTFFEVLPSLALIRGQMREHFSWLHTDVSNHTVYFNLNNDAHEIAKITPGGIELLKNGGNPDGIILEDSQKMMPIRYLGDADLEEADRKLVEVLVNNIACSDQDRLLILSWLSCFLLIDFSGTRPMTRFEGPAGSGKTTASKLISTLLYGSPQHKKATDAANYTDGSQNPLIALDNIEARQMTEELTTFMLTSITGIAKEKRKSGTDTETVIERTKCLLNTTGIEPLRGELSEIQSRTFVINFDIANQGGDSFSESEIIAEIAKHRDLILFTIMKRTRNVLAMMREGRRTQALRLLHEELGNHDKRRCNEYLSLMYLMLLAGSSPEEIEDGMQRLAPDFVEQIESINWTSRETARDSNQTATALAALVKEWRIAVEDDREMDPDSRRDTHVQEFIQKYQVAFSEDEKLENVLSRDLFVALRGITRGRNLRFDMDSTRQFAQRLANDLEVLREAGFEIEITKNRNGVKLYTIQQV